MIIQIILEEEKKTLSESLLTMKEQLGLNPLNPLQSDPLIKTEVIDKYANYAELSCDIYSRKELMLKFIQ